MLRNIETKSRKTDNDIEFSAEDHQKNFKSQNFSYFLSRSMIFCASLYTRWLSIKCMCAHEYESYTTTLLLFIRCVQKKKKNMSCISIKYSQIKNLSSNIHRWTFRVCIRMKRPLPRGKCHDTIAKNRKRERIRAALSRSFPRSRCVFFHENESRKKKKEND